MSKAKPAAKIEIRAPFPVSEVERLWSWLDSFRPQLADDFAPKTLEEYIELEISRAETTQIFAVTRDGEIGGAVWIQQTGPVQAQAHCVFKKEFWGYSTTLPALRQVAELVFNAGFRKISMTCFEDNRAIRSLLKQLGAKEEGLLRDHTVRNGDMVNMCLFGLVPSDLAPASE